MTETESDCGCGGDAHVTAVKLNHYVRTEPCAADFASYATFTFAGVTSEQAQRVLGHDELRSRAVLQADAPVWVGKKEQITNGTPTGWKQLATMAPLEIRNKQELFIMHTGVPVNVSVLNERWETGE